MNNNNKIACLGSQLVRIIIQLMLLLYLYLYIYIYDYL